MNRMTIVSLLSHIFAPISITAPNSEWKNLKYSNRMFDVKYNSSDAYLSFSYNDLYQTANDKISTSSMMFRSIITDESHRTFKLDFHNENELTLHINGQIPERWIRMMHDFHFTNSRLEHHPISTKFWEEKTKNIPEQTLVQLVEKFEQYNFHHFHQKTPLMKLKVIKAPAYNYRSDVKYSNYILTQDSFFGNPKFTTTNKENIEKSLWWREWKTWNGNFSPAVSIFAENCKKYRSFYGETISNLYKAEGGIKMSYLFNMKQYLMFNPTSMEIINKNYLRNENDYCSNECNLEEMIVLEEAMKKEGVVFESKIMNF